ncbi:MAG TPA: hypothetical protein VMV49_02040 [Candidatus Deferrimicrobium sp.]|nr:hypothetical protein [Candidatus Deferrimicrobium sp.]
MVHIFAKPPDFSGHITALGMWTHEVMMPAQIKYPNKLGINDPISWETFEKVGEYSQEALEKLYVKVVKWDYKRRCLSGARLYTNWLAGFALFGKSMTLNLKTPQKTYSYIPIFRSYPGGIHPFMRRFDRSEKEEKEDPSFYLMVE